MKARYNKYFETDPGKATEYILSEPEDTSRYVSVQYYTDNVMNVALPSTYRFMEKVIQELNAMYQEAGLSLSTVHLGGDEVPRGVWMGSPKCQELMKEKGMTKAHDLSEYFITQMADVMQKNGLKFSGWQEVALGHTEEAHQQLRGQAAGVYCWNTVPGSDEVVYQTANNGYPVILATWAISIWIWLTMVIRTSVDSIGEVMWMSLSLSLCFLSAFIVRCVWIWQAIPLI